VTAASDVRAGAAAGSATREVELTIGGMTCAACAARVEKKLNKLPDVRATVNFATATARVTAPAAMPVDELTATVEKAGYTAAEPARRDPADGSGAAQDIAYLKRRLIVALIFFVPLTDLSLVLSLMPSVRFAGWQWLLVACAAPVALYCAWPFHRAALTNARHGTATMDTLVSLGIIAACGWSVYAMFFLDRGPRAEGVWAQLVHASGGGIYLETAATVTTFLLAGRLYEARARRKAGEAMRELAATAAKEVWIAGQDGTLRRVPAGELKAGDVFVVKPGETIAADGEVLFGQTTLDRSMMTGESVPAEAAEGDPVIGGTVVLTGRLVIRADRVGADTQLSQLIRLVEQAQAQKAAIQRLADRICGIFVPAVLACAALTLTGWLVAGSPAEHAFSAGLAVLIIACPCAMGLATPAALVAACGRGAQLGIFIKGYQALESSRSVQVVVLDKTGTITTGRMSVVAVLPAKETNRAERGGEDVGRAELLRYAGAVEQASEHAVAAAITAAALASALAVASVAAAGPGVTPLPQAEDFEALPGLGARGVVDGREVVIGRERLFAERGIAVPDDLVTRCRAWEEAGRTTVLVGWDGESAGAGSRTGSVVARGTGSGTGTVVARGAIAVADTIKPSAAAAVAQLRGLGLDPVLLTGDNEATARAVAAAVGIDQVIAGTLPAAKAEVIAGLQAAGRRVAMVGDGVNDAPALAAADLGLALGTGTDIAISAADMILLRDDLRVVGDAIALARATLRTIRRNLRWAFGYNIAALPLAALGFLNPIIASAAMTLSSIFVVASSLRLQRFDTTGERHARLHPRQEQLPQAAAPHRGPGTWPAAHDRRRPVLHRHPHPGLRGDQGPAVGRPGLAGGAPGPLRHPGRRRRRRRRVGEGTRSLRSDRPPGPFLNDRLLKR
jgi:P-type Cu+ transporter